MELTFENKIIKQVFDRTLVIVLAHPNDDNKVNILNECLKGISFPKLLCCNYVLTKETQNMCDWTLYTKENPLLYSNDFSKYDINLSTWKTNENGQIEYSTHKFDNGWAVIHLIKNALGYAKHLKKDLIHIVNYDFTITDEILLENTMEMFENDLIIYSCPSHSFNIPACSSAFFSGKLNTIESFFNQYNSISEYYLNTKHGHFLEEKFYSFTKSNVSRVKEKTLKYLGSKCLIGRYSIISDFDKIDTTK